jgi:hypothetical protein
MEITNPPAGDFMITNKRNEESLDERRRECIAGCAPHVKQERLGVIAGEHAFLFQLCAVIPPVRLEIRVIDRSERERNHEVH